jgi:hypothetical protein
MSPPHHVEPVGNNFAAWENSNATSARMQQEHAKIVGYATACAGTRESVFSKSVCQATAPLQRGRIEAYANDNSNIDSEMTLLCAESAT